MSEADTRRQLTALLREILEDQSVDPQVDDSDDDIPGFDSGAKLQLLMAVEERLGIRLRSREVDGLRRFGDWVVLIHRRQATG